MLTDRENLMEVINRGKPERFANQYDPFHLLYTPVLIHDNYPIKGGPNTINDWGVELSWGADQPGAFPIHSPEKIVMPDITRWKEAVEAPPTVYGDTEWEPVLAEAESVDQRQRIVAPCVMPGIFEQTHYLGEITRILTDFYEHPQELKDLIKYLTEWELSLAEEICDHLNPEAIFRQDDWGTNTSTFISPGMFDDFLLEPYKEINSYYHDRGCKLIIHHSDSYAATLIPEMIDMGINIWQGVMRTNDIPKCIKLYGDKITFMGGVDSTIVDVPDWSVDLIAEEVKSICGQCGPLSFIPSQTQGINFSSFPGVYEAIHDSIDAYSTEYFKKWNPDDGIRVGHINSEACDSPLPDEAPEEGGSIFDEISEAVQHGKRKDVKALVQKAVDDGCSPEDILNKGLVAAMSIIGDKFSAGEVFVPEMLIAARAMGAGTKVLKPYLTEEGAEPIGKAVIGTVKGDQHDIGKNLVRMMIEGKGFEVTDLGTDVPAETFVSFLQEHDDIDIVCCSALLTTTVPEINTTIKAIEEAGLRDQVKIMIGGAPVTQAYADEVGADAYTEDAGQAAVRAVELLSEK